MELNKVYQTNRSNQDKTAGILVFGATADVTIYGCQEKPTTIDDMVDLGDGSTTINEGAWPIVLLTEFICVQGTADKLQIVGIGLSNTGLTFE